MKLFTIFFLIIFSAVLLFSVTNPGADEFRLWYEKNYEAGVKNNINNEIRRNLKTDNDTMQILINGVYEMFARDKMDVIVDRYLESIWDDVSVERYLFYTEYYIKITGGRDRRILGYLNSFHEVDLSN